MFELQPKRPSKYQALATPYQKTNNRCQNALYKQLKKFVISILDEVAVVWQNLLHRFRERAGKETLMALSGNHLQRFFGDGPLSLN